MDPYVFSGILTNTELNKLHKVVKLYWQRAWTQIWADFSISFSLVRKNELFFQSGVRITNNNTSGKFDQT